MLFDKFIDRVLEDHGIKPKQVNPLVAFPGMVESGVRDTTEEAYGDVEAIAETYEKLVWVYRCISVIATNIASLPIKIYRVDASGNKTDISSSPDFNIIYKPNSFQTQYDFWMESISRLQLQGELFWELDFQGGARPKVMYADWRSEEVTIKTDPEQFITQFIRLVNMKQYKYDPRQVFFIKHFNSSSVTRGMAPLRSGRQVLTLELNALKYNVNFFKQGMKFSGILQTPDEINDAERKRLRESFTKIYSGTDKAHQVGILWGGLTFTPLNAMTMQEAEFTKLREMNREEICSIFGVPLEIAGVGRKTYENWKEARRSFWQETLLPLILKVYSLLNDFFVPMLTNRNDVLMEPDLSNVEALKEDRDIKAKRFFEGFKNVAVTPNEIRTEALGLDPVDDPAMNVPYIPLNLIPAIGSSSLQGERAVGKASDYDYRTRLWYNKIIRITPHELILNRAMKRFFKRQAREVINNLRENKSKADLEIEGQVFNLEYWKQELEKVTSPIIADTVLDAINELLEKGEEIDLTHPVIQRITGKRVTELSQFVNSTTAEKVGDIVRQGFSEGLSVDEIADQLTNAEGILGEQVSTKRARLISRTEAYGAANSGTQDGMILGGYERKMWLTSRDERVRESHQIDGQVVGVNEFFVLADGEKVLYPQDYNERCVHIPTNEPRNIGD